MHKVISHDMPNQLVALQSLLQMLELEENERLSTDGQEYVQRLQKVTRRTVEMVRFLKEMGKLQGYASKPEPIALVTLARELQGTLKQQFPPMQFAFEWNWVVPTLVVDYRTFMQGLTEILVFSTPAHASACRLQAHSQPLGNQIMLKFLLEYSTPQHENNAHSGSAGQSSFEQRMEIILAREWLAISEATLAIDRPKHGDGITIIVPSRLAM